METMEYVKAEEKLKLCPFCGSDKLAEVAHTGNLSKPGRQFVRCECTAQGPYVEYTMAPENPCLQEMQEGMKKVGLATEKSVSLWNKRKDAQEPIPMKKILSITELMALPDGHYWALYSLTGTLCVVEKRDELFRIPGRQRVHVYKVMKEYYSGFVKIEPPGLKSNTEDSSQDLMIDRVHQFWVAVDTYDSDHRCLHLYDEKPLKHVYKKIYKARKNTTFYSIHTLGLKLGFRPNFPPEWLEETEPFRIEITVASTMNRL
jgi:hypothetical protein